MQSIIAYLIFIKKEEKHITYKSFINFKRQRYAASKGRPMPIAAYYLLPMFLFRFILVFYGF